MFKLRGSILFKKTLTNGSEHSFEESNDRDNRQLRFVSCTRKTSNLNYIHQLIFQISFSGLRSSTIPWSFSIFVQL